MKILKCKICGHGWRPRVENPAECPSCKSRLWKKGIGKEKEEKGRNDDN
jgi:predicted Zn-ribbon and HTH transcriptional regulator